MAIRIYDDQIVDGKDDGVINVDEKVRDLAQGDLKDRSEVEGIKSAEEGAAQTAPSKDTGTDPVDSIKQKELAPKTSSKSTDENKIGYGFKKDPKGDKTKGKGSVSKKKIVGIVGGVVGAVIGLVTIALFLMSSLKLPQLMSNIQTMEFARLSRNLTQATADLTSEELSLELSDTRFSRLSESLSERFPEFSAKTSELWGKLDKWRPQKLISNLEGEGKLSFIYEQKEFLGGLRKQVVKGIVINGETITPGDAKWYQLFENRADRLTAAGEIKGAVDSVLGGSNTVVRGAVAKSIRERAGIRLRRWSRIDPNFTEGKRIGNLAQEIKKTVQETKPQPLEDTSVVPEISEAKKAVEELVDKCIEDMGCLEQEAREQLYNYDKAAAVEGSTKEAIAAKEASTTTLERTAAALVDEKVKSTLFKEILDKVGTLYAIMMPVCIIYDNSVNNSGSTVEENSQRAVKTYYTLAAAADQQKSGALIADQASGLNDEIGDISNAPSELKAAGKKIDTNNYANPEASTLQTYNIVNTYLGDGVFSGLIQDTLDTTCPIVLDLKVAAAMATLEVVFQAATLTTGTAAEEGFKALVLAKIKKTVADITLKESLVKYAAKWVAKKALITGVIVGGTIGLSELANFAVMGRMGNTASPIPDGNDLQVQADQGGIIVSNDLNRQMLAGRPLTTPEVVASNYQDLQDIAYANSKKSVFDRYFSPNNSRSMMARMAVGFNGFISRSIFTNFTSMFSRLGTIYQPSAPFFMSILPGNQQKAFAAESNSNYNIVQWGWSIDEENLIHDNPNKYSPLNNAQEWENMPDSTEKSEAIKLVDECTGDSLGKLLGGDSRIKRDEDGKIKDNEGRCAPNNLGPSNELAFMYRVYKRNSNTIDHLNSIAEPTIETAADNACATSTETSADYAKCKVGVPTTKSKTEQCQAANGQLVTDSIFGGGNVTKASLAAEMARCMAAP